MMSESDEKSGVTSGDGREDSPYIGEEERGEKEDRRNEPQSDPTNQHTRVNQNHKLDTKISDEGRDTDESDNDDSDDDGDAQDLSRLPDGGFGWVVALASFGITVRAREKEIQSIVGLKAKYNSQEQFCQVKPLTKVMSSP